jgi:predicted nucleotidyltransferase
MEPRHEQIARIALGAGARYGLALAGGYAVAAHGMGNRSSGDVDLFTSWQHRGDFPELTAAVVAALEAAGYKVSVIMSAETFTRLTLASPEGGAEEKVELAVGDVVFSWDRQKEATVNLDEIKALGARLAELCRRYGIAELAVFGSVARGDAGPDSDVDLLYVRVPGNDLGMAYFDLQDDLERLFGHSVDLVAKEGLHRVIRDQVLADAQVLYAA